MPVRWFRVHNSNTMDELIGEIEKRGLWEKEITLDRGEFLATPGMLDTNLYLVVSGAMRMFVIDEEIEHTIRFGYRSNLIAVLDCLMTDKPTELYMQALKKTHLKSISQEAFEDFLSSDPALAGMYEVILKSFVHQQMEREMDLLTSSPKERYLRVLKRSPRVFQEIPHKYIASYLRMTPETLSRVKKEAD